MASRSVKYIYSIMGLCLYLTDTLTKINTDEEILSMCNQIKKDSHNCFLAWGEPLSKKELRGIRASLIDIFKREESALKIIAFILDALSEVRKKVKSKKLIAIDALIDDLMKLNLIFNERLDDTPPV